MRFFFCAVLAAAGLIAPVQADVTLIHEGRPTAAIVLAERPTRSAQLAACELQEHLRLASGAVVPILPETQARPPEAVPIYVGESRATRAMGLMSCQFQPQEWLVRVTDREVVLLGRDDPDTGPIAYDKEGAWPGFQTAKAFYRLGTLYAAYEFLERFVGVRWYMVTDIGRVVPKRSSLAVEPVELRRRPWTIYRQIGSGGWGQPGDVGEVDLYGMRRYKALASLRDRNLHMLRTRGGGEPFGVNHSVYDYHARFGQSHPEWFVHHNPGPHTQLLYHLPAVIDQVAQDALEYFALPFSKRRFGAKQTMASGVAAGDFFPVMPLDNRDYGEQTQPPLQPQRQGRGFGSGVASHYIFTWVNAVARRVAEVHPDAWISTCAYAGMFEPPDFDMEPNVAVCVAMADGWDETGYGVEMLRAWRRRVARLYTWEYYYANRRFPDIRPHRVARYIAGTLYPLRPEGMFMEWGDVNPVLYHLDHYVTMRLLCEGTLEVEAILEEFARLFYGPAAVPMARFWKTLEAMSERARGATPSRSWVVAAEGQALESLQKDLAEAQRLAPEEPYATRLRLMRQAGLDLIEEGVRFGRQVEAAGTPRLDVPRTASAPAIDGRLEEPAWTSAASTPAFVTMLNQPQDVRTVALLCYDDRALYVAWRCEEPFMDTQTLHQVKPSSALCTDDSVELNVDPTPATPDYLQVMVNAKGLCWWWWREKHRPQDLPDLGLQAAAVRGQGEWTVELAVPFARLSGRPPAAGETWTLNVMRNRAAQGAKFKRFDERIWSCWSPPFAWSWHIKDRFGTITFRK